MREKQEWQDLTGFGNSYHFCFFFHYAFLIAVADWKALASANNSRATGI